MPVSTEIARAGSVEGYGFNSFLASIDIVQSEEHTGCEIRDRDTLVCVLAGRKIDASGSNMRRTMLYSYQNGKLQYYEVKSVALQSGMSLGSKNEALELGKEHAVGRELADILISRQAFMYIYAPRIQAVLFGPERLHPQLIKLGVDSLFPQARLREKEERRHASRERVNIPCEIDGSSIGRKSHAAARVKDLSEQGMFIETDTQLDEGTNMRAAVNPQEIEKILWVKGRVTRALPHGAAVRFIEDIPKDLNHVIFH